MRAPTVAIVGAGMSGICMGAKLKRAGIDRFTIYEKGSELGGTWRDNTYPGLACDVPSHFYQYTFALDPSWTHVYSPGAEIWSYLDRVADQEDVRPHIRFDEEVCEARFDGGRWHVRTSSGEEDEADFLIAACGVLHHPRSPNFEGLDDFAGSAFHSARWDHHVELAGRRVGVVGTGSTAVQIVTEIASHIESLSLFQRTAQWILPVPNRRILKTTRAALARFPALNKLAYRASQTMFEGFFSKAVVAPGWQRTLIGGICRANLRSVRDPDLRRRLTPDYDPMCKRLVVSSGFYRAVQRENVALVTEPIERVEPDGVRTRDGRLYELDVLVLATGFDTHAYVRPMRLVGEGGVTLDELWSEGPRAYRTVALPGFPNYFMLMGPHSPVGNHSLMPIAEVQADYALKWIRLWQAGEVDQIMPTEVATRRFNDEVRAAMPKTVWTTGCDSWYLGKDGVPELWPWTPADHREMLREPALEEFELRREPSPVASPG